MNLALSAASWLTPWRTNTSDYGYRTQANLLGENQLPSRSYRYLARRVFLDLDGDERPLMIVLSGGCRALLMDEIAVLFAACYAAETGQRILLVDGAMMSTSAGLSGRFASEGSAGLSELLCGDATDPAELIQPTTVDRVSFLPAGQGSTGSRPIERRHVTEIVAALRRAADVVIVVQGPIDSDLRYLQFCEEADLTLLTVEETRSRIGRIDEAEAVFAAYGIGNVKLLVSEPSRGGRA